MRCANHPAVESNKQCTHCQRFLCEACIKKIKAGSGVLEACVKCQGPVRVAAVRVPPLGEQLRDLLARPVSGEGLVTAVALAVPYWLSRWVPIIGPFLYLVYVAAVVGYYFQIIDHIGRDRDGLPGPSDTTDDAYGMFIDMMRGIICLLMGTAPLLLWFFFSRHGDPENAPAHPRLIVLGLLLVGQLYLPALILTVTITNSTAGAIWPVTWLRIIARAPASYLMLVLLFVASVIALFAGQALAEVTLGRLPFVGSLATATVGNVLLFTQACLVGGHLRRHAEVLGYD